MNVSTSAEDQWARSFFIPFQDWQNPKFEYGRVKGEWEIPVPEETKTFTEKLIKLGFKVRSVIKSRLIITPPPDYSWQVADPRDGRKINIIDKDGKTIIHCFFKNTVQGSGSSIWA